MGQGASPPVVSQSAEATLTARVARARVLATEHPAAAELLTFYADLAEYQKGLLYSGAETPDLHLYTPAAFRDGLDLEPALTAVPSFLHWLSTRARAQTMDADVNWREVIQAYVTGATDGAPLLDPSTMLAVTLSSPKGQPPDPFVTFVAAALVQPFAERLAAAWQKDAAGSQDSARCLVCGAAPVLGVLRPEGQGAKRALVCSLCLTEHDYMRVICPACGERRFEALPIYTAEQFDHVRIDACDSCHRYLKTIDLTKNGLAVPAVDDIASVSLDLWARDRGYERLQRNLLGI